MKQSVKSLSGFAIGGVDGDIGKLKEFYFDDRTWTIQYLIADTGNWLPGRKVLISSEALLKPNWEERVFSVNLTRNQIENSPAIDTDKPVSRQQETELLNYYPRSGFWGGGLLTGGKGSKSAIREVQKNIAQAKEREADNNPHLRSTAEVSGYKISAKDGDIGEVDDFLIDDSSLEISYLVVDTGKWFPGKKVLISPEWIKEISWNSSEITVKAAVEQVKNCPEYDAGKYLSDEYEANLQNYYGRFIS